MTFHLDPYQPQVSIMHRLDPRIKVILTLAYLLAMTLTPPGAWPIYLLLLSIVIAAVILAELRSRFVLERSLIALPFTFAALPLAFTEHGEPWGHITLGCISLTVTNAGVMRLLSIMIRSWGSILAVVVLVGSTPFPHLLLAMRTLRMPRLLVSIVELMWRYLFVLVDEAIRLSRARAARSGRQDKGGSLIWRAHVTGSMIGSLFLRAFDRADRIYEAMVSRGYDGDVRTLPLPPLDGASWWVLSGGIAILMTLTFLGMVFWG